jgi:hypothetical protein
MSAAAAMRLTQLHGEPKSTLVGPAHARDGTEVPVLPWPDQTPHNGDAEGKLLVNAVGMNLRGAAIASPCSVRCGVPCLGGCEGRY